MERNSKADLYYKKLLDIRNNLGAYKDIKSLSSNKVSIRSALRKIIDNNYDHLLTDAYIYYLIATSMSGDKTNFRNNLYHKLIDMTNKDLLIPRLSSYVDCIRNGLRDYSFHNYSKDFRLLYLKDMLNGEEQKLYEDFNFSIIRIYSDNSFGDPEYVILKKIFEVYAALSLLNNNIDNYNVLVEPYLENPLGMIDELRLQGVCNLYNDKDMGFGYDYKEPDLINYLINNRNNSIKKLIK